MTAGSAGARKRKHDAVVSIVDVLVRDYGDDWVKWEVYMNSEDGAELAAGSKAGIWDHLRGYKKKIDTWPQKERRKAFRSLYRKLRPQAGMSGSLSMASTAVDHTSPLALPQLDGGNQAEMMANPLLTGIDDMVDIDDDDIMQLAAAGNPPATTTPTAAPAGTPAPAPYAPPSHFIIHNHISIPSPSGPEGKRVLTHHIPSFSHGETENEPINCVKRLVDEEVNALANHGGGHVFVGIDNLCVMGYHLNRKQRDNVRLAVDNAMDRWDPRPVLQDLVDVSFVDVRSSVKRTIANHCVVCIAVTKSAHPVKNSRGEAVKLDGMERNAKKARMQHSRKRAW